MAAYYDIFIRNAFGNLPRSSQGSCLQSRHGRDGKLSKIEVTWVYLQKYRSFEYPDENFAREIMQLVSIRLVELNPDGTHIVDNNDELVRVYSNDDIVKYARVWTGFKLRGQGHRRNVEDASYAR